VSHVSIIIPALNEEKNLARVLPAVMAQVGPGDEVIVVDNGSDDKTVAVAKSFNAKVLVESKRGRGRARNAGIKHAEGEFVVFLDADCVPESNWLKNLLNPFSDNGIGCSGGEIATVGAATPLSEFLAGRGHLSQTATARHPFLPFAQTGNVAFRRNVIERIGVFDESLDEGENADLCWRMQLQTQYRITFTGDALATHLHSFSAKSLLRQKLRHARGMVMLFKKYKKQWTAPIPTWKTLYWEYHSIFRRGLKLIWDLGVAKTRLGTVPPADQRYQLILEIGEKLGRISGSIQHRVWYP